MNNPQRLPRVYPSAAFCRRRIKIAHHPGSHSDSATGPAPGLHDVARTPRVRPLRGHQLFLLVLCLAPFTVVLESNDISLALPQIQRAFALSQTSLQWVVSANTLVFGSLLPLGGRAADVYGPRRTLLAGFCVFFLASAASTAAVSEPMLIAARALQGTGAALAFPSALSLITTTFPEGLPRNSALGIYGMTISGAVVSGATLGGLLTQLIGWRAVLGLDAFLGCLGLFATSCVVPNLPRGQGSVSADLPKGLALTAGLFTFLYALTSVTHTGWLSPQTLLPFFLGLSAVIVAWRADGASQRPLLTGQLLKRYTLAAAGAAAFFTVAAVASVIVVLSLYIQELLQRSPLETGFALAPLGVAGLVSSRLSPRVAQRYGVVSVLVATLLLQAIGIAIMIPLETSCGISVILAGATVMGVGHFGATVTSTALATRGIAPSDQGVTNAVVSSAQAIGAAFGIALLLTIEASRESAFGGRAGTAAAAVAGYQWALATAAVLTVLAIFSVLVIVGHARRRRRPHRPCQRAIRGR